MWPGEGAAGPLEGRSHPVPRFPHWQSGVTDPPPPVVGVRLSQRPRSTRQCRAGDPRRARRAKARAGAAGPGPYHLPDLGLLARREPTWPGSRLRDCPSVGGGPGLYQSAQRRACCVTGVPNASAACPGGSFLCVPGVPGGGAGSCAHTIIQRPGDGAAVTPNAPGHLQRCARRPRATVTVLVSLTGLLITQRSPAWALGSEGPGSR